MANICGGLLKRYIFKNQTTIAAKFDKQDEENQVLNETEVFINLSNRYTLAESDIDITAIKSSLEQQIQNQKLKVSGWRFDKINSLTIYFHKTTQLNGTSYNKIPLRNSAFLKIENDDKYCFLWSH